MPIAVYNATISLPLEQAWQKLRDLSLAHHYVPGINRCEIKTAQREGVGVSRRVSGPQQWLDETVIEWNEGRGFTIRLHKGDQAPKPFAEGKFVYRLDKIDDKRCKITCTMIYEMGMGWFGKLLHSLLIEKIVRNNVRDVSLGLAHFYQTGQPVTNADRKMLRENDRKNAKPFP